MQYNFFEEMQKAGIPTTQADLIREIKQISTQNGLDIINPSEYSPFWRVIKHLFIIPFLQVILFIGEKMIPNCYLKTATGSFLDIIAFTYNITRKAATFAIGQIQFTKADPMANVDIPKGTIIRTPLINGKIYRLKTIEPISIPPEQSTAFIHVEALESGYASNLGQGYYIALEEPFNGVSVKNLADWITSPGADEENDEALRLRVRNLFIAASQWHTDAKYKAMISAQSGLDIDRIFFNHTTPRGAGSADIFILFDVADDSETYLNSLTHYIVNQGNHGHGDDVQIKTLPPKNFNLYVNLRLTPNIENTEKVEIKNKVQDFIRCAFRENQAFPINVCTRVTPATPFSFSKLFAEIHAQIPKIEELTTSANPTVDSFEILRLGSLTISEV